MRTLPKFPPNPTKNRESNLDDRSPSSFDPKPPKTSPLQMLVMISVGILAVGTVLIPTLISLQQRHVISIQANDESASALGDIKIAKQHCVVATQSLKEKDYAIAIEFADRPEVKRSAVVEDIANLLKKCDDIRRDRISPALGKQDGTNLIALLKEAQFQLKLRRTNGNQDPGVLTIWLQNAEPRFKGGSLDVKQVRSLLQQITNDRSTVAIFGPTGDLLSELEKAIQDNSRVVVCPIADSEADAKACVKRAFDRGRELPDRGRKQP